MKIPERHARVDVADVLRGFAVMAIVLLHSIEHFNFYQFPDTAGQSAWLNFTDKAIWDSLFFAFSGKAYAIFALLFGFSFFIQHDNQRMRGNDFRMRFCWRLLILFVIGNINACFFTGEILVFYSLMGLVLVLTCRLSNRLLLWLIAICMLQPVSVYHIVRMLVAPDYVPATLDTGTLWMNCNAVQSSGNFLETIKVNLWDGQLFDLAYSWEHGRVFQTAGLFMAGMLIGRQGWFLADKLKYWGWVLAAALVCYFPLTGLDGMIDGFVSNPHMLKQMHVILSSLSKLCFMLILVCGILFGYYRTRGISRVLSLLIPYGKMSMTNYVTQGMIGAFIFYHWGLYIQLGITASVFVGIGIFVLQYLFCRFWVGRHSHGPLEYIWKKATWI